MNQGSNPKQGSHLGKDHTLDSIEGREYNLYLAKMLSYSQGSGGGRMQV